MSEADEIPELDFFRSTPDCLMTRPPLCSSFQNLESCFFMIALGRFPHALVTVPHLLKVRSSQLLTCPLTSQ